MWLLSTDRAELRFFSDAMAVPGGYAILSHTWGRDEQTFQDIKALSEQCKANGTNPRDFVSNKIRGCCILAEHHGYAWAWVDSCCIDKTSSSELSESINSMFLWYTQADVCYVYMGDVPDKCYIYASDSEFRRSRWHTRGWTLQELIAPAMVIFLSREWTFLGRRDNPVLARLLEDITGIPALLLMRFTRVHEYGIATRMSWGSKRNTTRLEDEAYCLMGLFDVNMPTIYGEGRRAFQRLQLEIMKNSSDTSLFVWGDRVSYTPLETQGLSASSWDEVHEDSQGLDFNYLLASSPHSFDSGEVYFTPANSNPLQHYPPTGNKAKRGFNLKIKGPFDRVELPKFTSTSYGIECRFPIVTADDYTIAVLLCETNHDHLGLLLHEDTSGKDPTRPRYFTSNTFDSTDPSKRYVWIARIVTLGSDLDHLRFNGKVVKATWRTIYIMPISPSIQYPTASFSRRPLENALDAAFRIPHWLIATFATLKFTGTDRDTGYDQRGSETVYRVRFFQVALESETIYIELGLCSNTPASTSTSPSSFTYVASHNPRSPRSHARTPCQWARVSLSSSSDPASGVDHELAPSSLHNCREDHIDAWPMRTKVFSNPGPNGEPKRAVCISFDPCRISPGTLVLHLDLLGPVYEKMLHDANVTIPTRESLRGGPGTQGVAVLEAAVSPSDTDGISMPPASNFAAPQAPTVAT